MNFLRPINEQNILVNKTIYERNGEKLVIGVEGKTGSEHAYHLFKQTSIVPNCWIIDYAQINALYKDFVPQKELSAEKKYFPSSFIHSHKNSNATPSILASMPNENVSLDFTVQSLIKERDNVKLEYQKLFNSIKKTRSQTQTEMDEFIAHVFEKTYAYGAIRAENQNLLFTKSELKTRLANVEKDKSVNTKFDKTNGS
ncbi:hypothetical protein Tco_0703871 [Tanacetum coccineum]|uniref:Uncharacterized protein n=1 Tax=Tanacetum coccineum TaxID=301880 RepID=A0ABQ4Y117_9ASTR